MSKSRLMLETKRKLYLFALTLASAATITGVVKNKKEVENIPIETEIQTNDFMDTNTTVYSLEEMYEEKVEISDTFSKSELMIATRFPEMNPEEARDYFFISKNQYVEYKSQAPGFGVTYTKYPQLTNQENYVTDYQITAFQGDFEMIPCEVKLSKEINWLSQSNVCFRHGVFELEEILSPEMIKEEYNINQLKEIENIINDVNYDYTSNREETYSIADLALLESFQKIYIVDKRNYVLTAEPLESLQEMQHGYMYYSSVTNPNQTISKQIDWNTKTKEITCHYVDYVSTDSWEVGTEPTWFYTEKISSYLPEEVKQNSYTKDELIKLEEYVNAHKEELLSTKGKSR